MKKRVSLVTGATGFIGKRLVKALLEQGHDKIYLLVRSSSFWKAEKLVGQLSRTFPDAGERLVPIAGDITDGEVIGDRSNRSTVCREVENIYHLAAKYQLGISRDEALRANVDGTLNLLDLARKCKKLKCLHYVSTLAVAGNYRGLWLEEMLIEGQGFDNHYAHTKFLAEVEVREAMSEIPIAVYRPGIVVGDSVTGEMDKIDGPYYLLVPFLKLQAFTSKISTWIPIVFPIAPGGDRIKCHIVPVDYVVDALVYISSLNGIQGKTFSLTDPNPPTTREFIDIFCEKAGWIKPFFNVSTDPLVWFLRLPGIKELAHSLEPVTNVPVEIVHYTSYDVEYSTTNTQEALKDSGISCPELATYASKLLKYARKHLV
ncbi:MAG: SDR family oxidoreductase [Acidobacteriota bacterium]|nr:SDR family oxidoreductase [Blastocatellia bacterium]MDW8411601.1 SDR family oxidoreductase [Acidobacteriota bacterium]